MAEKTVLLRLGADATGLTKGLRDGQKGLKDFEGGVSSAVGKLTELAAVAGLGLGLAKLVSDSLAFADSMTKLAERTGASTDEVQRWNFIAANTGTTAEALAETVNKLQRNLVAADQDGGKAAQALMALGLSAESVLKMAPADQLSAIADAIAKIEDPAKRTAVATDLLGKSGAASIPTLLEMADKTAKLRDGLDSIGGPVSEEAIRKVDGLGDSLGVTHIAVTNLATSLLSEISPALITALGHVNDFAGGLRVMLGEGSNAAVNLSDKIVDLSDQIDLIKSGVGTTAFTSDDDLHNMEAQLVVLRNQYDVMMKLGEAGARAYSEERLAKYMELQKALTDGTLAEIEVRATRETEHRFKDEAEEAAHQQHKIDLLGAANKAVLDQDLKFREQMAEQASIGAIAEQDVVHKGLSQLEQFRAQSWDGQVKTVSGSLVQMTAGIAQHSKAAFNINKAATIANVIVNTIQAVTKAWSDFGWPVGAIVGAAVAAAGIAQLNAVKSTQFQGGGQGLPPSSATTPPVPTAAAGGGGGGGGGQTLRVEGLDGSSLFTGKAVRALAERLAEHQKDGGTVIFS